MMGNNEKIALPFIGWYDLSKGKKKRVKYEQKTSFIQNIYYILHNEDLLYWLG